MMHIQPVMRIQTAQQQQIVPHHFGNMQFIAPQQMIQLLLMTPEQKCHCQEEEVVVNHSYVLQDIKTLQAEITNIRTEAVQADNLLSIRDSLYSELNQLRQERELIQTEIQVSLNAQTTVVKVGGGYKEMNERLRRRIFQVREYIDKMGFQNQKIEEGIIASNYVGSREENTFIKRNIYQTNSYIPHEGKAEKWNNIESMMSRLNEKQEQAWQRVRRQQDGIQKRNRMARERKQNSNITYHNSKNRTYYSPQRDYY